MPLVKNHGERLRRSMKDYELYPEFGRGVFDNLMGPIINAFFEGGLEYSKIEKLSYRLFAAIAREYGQDDILERHPYDPGLLERVIDQQGEHLGIRIDDEGRRAVAFAELICFNIATTARWCILGEKSGRKFPAFMEVALQGTGEKLILPGGVMLDGLVRIDNLRVKDVGRFRLIIEGGRVSADEVKVFADSLAKLEELARFSVGGWVDEFRRGATFVIVGNLDGMRALIYREFEDSGVVLVGRDMLNEKVSSAGLLSIMAHELDHLDVLRMLLTAGLRGKSLMLMEYSANLVGLEVGRKVGADKDILKWWEESAGKNQRVIDGDAEAVFLTPEWGRGEGWFVRPGLINDFRRLERVFGEVLGEDDG